MTPTPEQIEAAKKWVLENIDNAYGFEGTAEHVWLSDWLAEYAAHCVAEATAEKDAEIERLREELDIWQSVFPDIAPESVQPDRSKMERRLAKLEAVAEAVLSELSGNPSELRDQVASAIRGDGSDLCDAPWEILSDDRKTGWRGDADRAIAAVKNYLITKAALEGEKADG